MFGYLKVRHVAPFIPSFLEAERRAFDTATFRIDLPAPDPTSACAFITNAGDSNRRMHAYGRAIAVTDLETGGSGPEFQFDCRSIFGDLALRVKKDQMSDHRAESLWPNRKGIFYHIPFLK